MFERRGPGPENRPRGLRVRGRRLRHAARASATRGLVGALDRVSSGTVVITEYPMQPRATYGWSQPPHGELTSILAAGRERYATLLDAACGSLDALRAIPRRSRVATEPRWENPYFSSLDAVALHTEFGRRRPARYVEVGSGHSTRFARRAIADHGLDTRLVSIDPHPRAVIDELCDEVHRAGLQSIDLTLFDELAAGDVLLIDGSHIAAMGSDVVTAFLDVLPRVRPGVLVGIDDVFLPWDYPDTWAGRFYSEQYLVAVMLLSRAPDWRVTFPGWFVGHDDLLADSVRRLEDPARTELGLHGTTIWLERV